MENAESQTVNVKTSTPKKFRWDNKMIEKLIDSLKEYKDTMLYNNLDFDSDRTAQYKQLRVMMAKFYEKR